MDIDLSQFCTFQYGIGFLREKKYGPEDYVLGFSKGLKLAYENPEHGREDDRINKWLDVYRGNEGYQTGDLRDIYPFNVLSQLHLDRIINGSRFEDWVQASPERGQLKKVTDTLWTWWVESDKIPWSAKPLLPAA